MFWRAKRLDAKVYSVEIHMNGNWHGTFDNNGSGISQKERAKIIDALAYKRKGCIWLSGHQIMIAHIVSVGWDYFTPWNEDKL